MPPPAPPGDQQTFQPPTPPRLLSFTLHGGLGIPVGDFGKSSGGTDGFAKSGLVIGCDLNYMLGDIASWVSSLDFSIHGFDEASLRISSGVSSDIGSWFLVWPMTGIRITASPSNEVRPYAQVQVGLLAGSSPSMSLSYGSEQFTWPCFCTVGSLFCGHWLHAGRTSSFGARYFYGEPEYENSIRSSSFNGTIKFKQPTSVFTLFLGVTPRIPMVL